MNAAWWKRAETAQLEGRTFWRCIEAAFAATALEGGPSFLEGGRYSVARRFSAVYLSENRALARLEKTRGRAELFEELKEMHVSCARAVEVPDLTRPELQARLQRDFDIGPGELTAAGIMAYQRTQPVGQSVFDAGFPAMLVPSCHPPERGQAGWRNLVLFPANALSSWLATPA